jgi:hypothetical protein
MPATYTSPKTMTNEPTIYSDWNTYVRDNELYFYQQVVTNPREKILVSAGYLSTASSSAETTVATVSVPGGSLSTTNSLMYEAYFAILNNAGSGAHHCHAKIYYDTLSAVGPISSDTYENSANYGSLYIRGVVTAAGATGSQWINCLAATVGGAATAYRGLGSNGDTLPTTGAIDSTAAKTAKITIQFDTNHASCISVCLYANIKLCTVGTAS